MASAQRLFSASTAWPGDLPGLFHIPSAPFHPAACSLHQDPAPGLSRWPLQVSPESEYDPGCRTPSGFQNRKAGAVQPRSSDIAGYLVTWAAPPRGTTVPAGIRGRSPPLSFTTDSSYSATGRLWRRAAAGGSGGWRDARARWGYTHTGATSSCAAPGAASQGPTSGRTQAEVSAWARCACRWRYGSATAPGSGRDGAVPARRAGPRQECLECSPPARAAPGAAGRPAHLRGRGAVPVCRGPKGLSQRPFFKCLRFGDQNGL